VAFVLVASACYDASGTSAPVQEGGEGVADPMPPRRNGTPTTTTEVSPAWDAGAADVMVAVPPAPLPQPSSPTPDAAAPQPPPVFAPDASAQITTPPPRDASCCDQAAATPQPMSRPVAKVVYAKEIRADAIEAGTIYAKSVYADSVSAMIHEDPGEARWNDANATDDLIAGSVQAEVIYVKELRARTVRARVIYAKDVTVTKK
jgi:hypothetical protein